MLTHRTPSFLFMLDTRMMGLQMLAEPLNVNKGPSLLPHSFLDLLLTESTIHRKDGFLTSMTLLLMLIHLCFIWNDTFAVFKSTRYWITEEVF